MTPPIATSSVARIEGSASRCLVCKGPLSPHRRLPGLHNCTTCGFVTLADEIDDEKLRLLYGADYFHGDEYADYIAEEPELRRNFRRRLDTLLELQPAHERHRLYEVGAAYGFFLVEAREHYEHVSGVDISEAAASHARQSTGVDVVATDFLQVQLDEKVDALCMWDTIEHLGRPHDFLVKASEVVREGGLLAITTGDIGSLNARMRGRRWRMIHPPTHLHYFSRETLTRLLDETGFDVIHVESAGNDRSLRAIFYALVVLKGGQRRLFERLQGLSLFNRGISLDLGDIMYVVAQRRAT